MAKHRALLVVIGASVALTGVGSHATPNSVGPDVIVADLYETHRWGSNPAGTIQAYSVGTISCNIGDEPLLWHNWDNQRPVIGQNMFRLQNGRFEQIGQSWLKWAFASLNQDFCAECIDPGTSSLLGVNCSDPYSASLNGLQVALGPKSVVNPFTGDFPANHATPGSGTIDGRLQVHTADLDPLQFPGARYYLEGQYVTPDDAAAGNLYNNPSYRQVWINAGNELSFQSPFGEMSQTVREEPAIMAWKAVDPAVGVRLVDVPGDGRLYLASKATELAGAAGWHYELAIHNLNSDRAVGGVTVMLPPDADPAELGFHDVDYHSGEPYSGTDWPGTVTGAGVHWETDSYTSNPNANALRWGTLYNFRFDALTPPTFVSQLELILFKPGDPSTLLVALDQSPYLLGDLDCSGAVDFGDINPFVLLLTNPAGWQAAYPGCPDINGDMNGSGAVGFDDINPFVALLSGGA